MITFDFETIGFHGLAVLIQYAEDDGEINLHDLWKEPVAKTLDLLRYIADREVIGFNLAFDWFHFQKIYSTFLLLEEHYGSDALPEDYIEEIADLEEQSRFLDVCIKPKSAMDIFLHARKGPYQSLMARKDIMIKRVPRELAPALAAELEKRIELDGIYFSKRSDPYAPKWQVFESDESRFKNVILKFNASGALKVLAKHALKAEAMVFTDIEPTNHPYEVGWAPFAKAISSRKENWRVKLKGKKAHRFAWPRLIQSHINHWRYYEPARKYGADDVIYTRDLWKHFGKPDLGDDDSILACMVGSVRWHGFRVDIEEIKKEREKTAQRKGSAPIDPTRAKAYISEELDEIEILEFTSTKKVELEALADMKCDCEEDNTQISNLTQLEIDFKNPLADGEVCDRCMGVGKHPAAIRAQEVLDSRRAKKEEEVLLKIIQAGRFHASFKVIGTLSSRMAGSDGLNAQGINNKPEVRGCFKLADPDFVLCGGDFDAFEVVIMDAVYPDANLHKHITTKKPCQKCDQTGEIDGKICDECNGTLEAAYKIHGLFAMEMFPHLSYADVIKSKGQAKDYYTLGKNGVFTMAYGGDEFTLINKYGVAEEVAIQAYNRWNRKYPDQAKERQKIFDMFCPMKQPGGLGTQVIWNEPADYIESIFGFRRYFTLENKICKALFDLAQDIPKAWRKLNIKVMRRDKEQKIAGAVSSALYGAAFSIQSSDMRAAANHVIQSAGATITKKVQRNIWDLQPSGVAPWRVTPMNCHDELMVPTKPEYVNQVNDIVNQTVESFRPQVPLIKMEWRSKLESWAEK